MRKLGSQVLLLLLVLGMAVSAHAQSSTVGSISGTVRDPQGAVVPNTEVTITEETTGVSRTVATDDNGFYSAPSLPVGRYALSVAPQGFKKTVNTGVELHIGDKLVVNLNVEVGMVSETVSVTSEAAPVETRNSDVSSLIGQKQVTELPLNGRNYAALATMVPGVSFANEAAAFGTRGTGLDSHVDMSVNGNQSNANMWTVDGVNNMDVGSNATLLVFPSIDSIAEFRVERNSFSAEYGQAQGAVINLVTKGGGNEFHGALFEFMRNDVLNANDFFLNQVTAPDSLDENGKSKRPTLRYNNFGGNFSGPIIKNRVFFWWSEEWRRERRGTILPSSVVPTAQERRGDFSGPIHSGPIPVDPYNPNPAFNPDLPVSATNQRYLPFPGNIIPADRLSPAGLALMGLFPLPNSGGGTTWVGAPTQPVNTRQDLIR
ncbi:MAG TPA: carboxypeptidase regulatory-like domain-containing protein, partial [Pyrinomonadaceae bacterium]|nr:carboxypeptidase regulatory-like domain-containing protein [Pyrinomonadaceae bacterium]